MMKIKKSKDILTSIKVKSLSIGDSGKGKTWFAGSICDHGKPFFIDAESGLSTIANKEFDYVQVNTWDEALAACTWYYQNWEKEGYTHLVVDSITRLQQYLVNKINPQGKPTMSEWGEILAHLRSLIDKLTKTCPTSLHVNAMAMESKDELSGGIKIYPNIQGAFKYDLAGYFDTVLYHDCAEKDGKQVYWVQTKGDQRITARNRFDSVKELQKFEANNYSILADIIGGN